MKNYDELWNQYAIAFNDKLESVYGGDWSKLDEVEQEIAALWKLAADMYSDGFDLFFLNWGYECYSYAMRGIKRIAEEEADCHDIYELFDTAYTAVFARFENDDRIKSYGDIPQYFTQEDEVLLEQTFETFDEELGPLLCERAYKFYSTSKGLN